MHEWKWLIFGLFFTVDAGLSLALGAHNDVNFYCAISFGCFAVQDILNAIRGRRDE